MSSIRYSNEMETLTRMKIFFSLYDFDPLCARGWVGCVVYSNAVYIYEMVQ